MTRDWQAWMRSLHHKTPAEQARAVFDLTDEETHEMWAQIASPEADTALTQFLERMQGK